jgi:hypothetical protein
MPPVIEPEHLVPIIVIAGIAGWLLNAGLVVVGCWMYNRFVGAKLAPPCSAPTDRVSALPRYGEIRQATPVREDPEARSREPATVPVALPVDPDDFASVGQELPAVRRTRNARPPGVPVPSYPYALLIVFVSWFVAGLFFLPLDLFLSAVAPPDLGLASLPKGTRGAGFNPADVLYGACWLLFCVVGISLLLHAAVQAAMLPTTFARSIGVTLCSVLAALLLGVALWVVLVVVLVPLRR